MMSAASRILPLVAALLLALTWLLVRSASPDAALHERVQEALRMVLLNDAALHRDVLRARAGLLRNYDPLVRSVQELRTATAALQELRSASGEAGSALAGHLQELVAAVEEQDSLIETFKSNNALLQNSLNYFSHASQQLGMMARSGNNLLGEALGALANALLRFTGDRSDKALEAISASLHRLGGLQTPPEARNQVMALEAHTRLIVSTLPDVDAVVARLLATPTSERARALQALYLDHHGEMAARAGTFRILLYIAAVILAAYLGYLFVRLRISAHTLRERLAFENLIAGISAGFINLPRERLAESVEQGLASLARGAGLDRACILLGSADGARVETAFRWPRDGSWPEKDDALLAAGLEWSLKSYARQGCIHVPSVAALPAGRERAALAARGVRSWVCVPLWHAGGQTGLLGLESVRREKRFAEDDIALLRMAGEIFANAIEREHGEAERDALEARLRQAQRMEAIGTLAGGIAHNFNNILSAILGYAEMTLARLPENSRPRHYVQEVRRAGERAKGIIDQILTFSQRIDSKRQPVDLRQVIDEALGLLRASLPGTIEFQTRMESADTVVMGDATQLQQVVVNLCTNAAQAMDVRGIVEIGLDVPVSRNEQNLSHGTLPAGRHVRLTVRDRGHGMDRATMERIFEPFFTTKAAGTGTGLGLTTVHGIVADHGGVLNVRSRPGEDTTFEAWFACAQAARPVSVPAGTPRPRGQGETILLVDDEMPLVTLGEEMLAELGYEPVGFSTARDALDALGADPQRFDLVLTDEAMPDMSGAEIAAAVHRLRPDMPVILMTGQARPIEPDRLQAAGFREYLRKPLSFDDIGRAIARHVPRQDPGFRCNRNAS